MAPNPDGAVLATAPGARNQAMKKGPLGGPASG
jgi:hypothetical protein